MTLARQAMLTAAIPPSKCHCQASCFLVTIVASSPGSQLIFSPPPAVHTW